MQTAGDGSNKGGSTSLAEAFAAAQSGGLCKLEVPWFLLPVYPKGRVGLEPRNPWKNLLSGVYLLPSVYSPFLPCPPPVQGTHRTGPLGQCAWLLAQVNNRGLLKPSQGLVHCCPVLVDSKSTFTLSAGVCFWTCVLFLQSILYLHSQVSCNILSHLRVCLLHQWLDSLACLCFHVVVSWGSVCLTSLRNLVFFLGLS